MNPSTHENHKHSTCNSKSSLDPWMPYLSQGCGVLLAGYCLYQAPKKFGKWVAVGIMAELFFDRVCGQKRISPEEACAEGCCGIGETISGKSLWRLEGIVLATYLFWRHVKHDFDPHMPIVGLYSGVGIYHHGINLAAWSWQKLSGNS